MLWIWTAPVVYAALACATVVPPPGQTPLPTPLPAEYVSVSPIKPPPKPGTLPAPDWDFLGVCTALNVVGVQSNPSLNPVPVPKK